MKEPNSYSAHWFEFFHVPVGDERTRRETEFVCAVAPSPEFPKVLDVCCGMGRHARALAERGYSVTGVERDGAAIAKARELGGGPEYVHADVRNYEAAVSAYDLAIVMSQSFGYFDAATNGDLLGRLAAGLRKGGRIILDLWNPEFFAAHEGERDLETASGVVRETKRVADRRLMAHLTYPNGAEENFDWQLFTPPDMRSLAKLFGLEVIVACTNFNPSTEPNADNPRIQFVLERV